MSRSVSELSVSADARTCKGRPYTCPGAGRLDSANRAQLRQAVIAGAREAAGLLVIDLSQLEHLDGQALYEFVRASQVTRHLGVGLALASSDPDMTHSETYRYGSADRAVQQRRGGGGGLLAGSPRGARCAWQARPASDRQTHHRPLPGKGLVKLPGLGSCNGSPAG